METIYSVLVWAVVACHVVWSQGALDGVRGLSFVTEQNKSTEAFAGTNQTFSWNFSLEAEEMSKEIQVQFGFWDTSYATVIYYLSTVVRESSGNETEFSNNDHAVGRRLYWVGNLTRNFCYAAFRLTNIQHSDSDVYGIRIRVYDRPPDVYEKSFTLTVKNPPPLPTKASEECNSALGMKRRMIPDENITASSSLSAKHIPAFARLSSQGAWCSAQEKSPYIQISLDGEKLITEVDTQGSMMDLRFATQYDVKYLKGKNWISYNKTLMGNRNCGAVQKNILKSPIRTSAIRIYPKEPVSLSFSDDVIVPCLRLELYGCSVSVHGDIGISSGKGLGSGSSGSGSRG